MFRSARTGSLATQAISEVKPELEHVNRALNDEEAVVAIGRAEEKVTCMRIIQPVTLTQMTLTVESKMLI